MISVIAFDYGGVIEVSGTNLIKEIVKYLNIEKSKWLQMYFSLNHLCNTGENTWEEVVLITAKELGASDSQLVYIKNLIIHCEASKIINIELIDYIKKLKSNFKIALISNYSRDLRQRLFDQKILDLFDEVIISGEVGYQKPQPEIFDILCNKMQVDISSLIFIDDTKRSLENAEVIGYKPILYTDNQKLFVDLSLILNL